MTIGLIRSVLIEVPTLFFQSLDFEDAGAVQAETIIEALVRFKAGLSWGNDQESPSGMSCILTTVERELVVDKQGQILIPRILPAKDMNNRYNSSMRPIYGENNSNRGRGIDTVLTLQQDNDHEGYYLEVDGPQAHPDDFQVTHSLALAYYVKGIGYAHVSLAKDKDASLQLVLSSRLASSVRPMTNLPLPIGQHEAYSWDSGAGARFLALVALHWLAMSIIDDMAPGEHLMVYEPDPVFATILRKAAEDRGVHTTFTTSTMTPQRCSFLGWLFIHPHVPTRDICHLAPEETSVFLICTNGGKRADDSSTEGRIIANLSSDCRTLYLTELCKRKAIIRAMSGGHAHELQRNLGKAISRAREDHTMKEVQAVSLDRISELKVTEDLTSEDIAKEPVVINWNRVAHLPLRIRPIDYRTLFSEAKTYWLAGLSSTLGLSLCEWMIGRGARYFVITSRDPQVSHSWLNRMSTMGAVIKIVAK